MEYRGIKINIVLLIIIIAMILYFTGNFIINKYNVEKPLIDEIKAIEGIEDIELNEENNKTKLKIKLTNNGDLYNVYKNVDNIASEKIDNYEIVVNNEENNNLQLVYFKLHYSIFEGIATKKFTVMNENIKEIAEKNNLKYYNLRIDSENVYLKLADNNSVFYYIIPRNSDNRGGENVG